MKKSLFVLLLALAATAASAAPAPAPEGLADLRGGRYAVKIEGLLCSACTRAILDEISRFKDVQAVTADFDKSELVITVKLDRTVSVSALRKALKRAAKRVNLDTRFEIDSIYYRPL